MIDQQAEEQHAAVMAIACALTADQQAKFLTRTRQWPGMNGAEVADILDLTISHDAYLGTTEPFFERHRDDVPECSTFAVLAALHALVILDRDVTVTRVVALLQRAGATPAPRYPEIEVGILLEDGETANTLLVRTRAEQALRAAGVIEDVITEFRQSVRAVPLAGYSRNVGDIAAWVTLVDAYMPAPGVKYDPVHDLAVVLIEAYVGNYRTRTSPQLAQALANLRERIDLTSTEGLEPSLRALLRRVN